MTARHAKQLLDWYDRHRRVLPWRALPGERTDPYLVWLSEIMLQQTTVAAVGPYFLRFVARFPSVGALAHASLDDVLHAWQGLGYYARARNLHKCAQAIVAAHGGQFPEDEAALLTLPGIGAYTAAAIAAIAFDRPAMPVDGNIERVVARLNAIDTPLPAAKAEIRARARDLLPDSRPGDFAQALMDLGATICTPRKPACALCPWRGVCAAHLGGIAEDLPRRAAKPARPVRTGIAYWGVRGDGKVALRRRPENGLLGGMIEVPWHENGAAAPLQADVWRTLPGQVRHVFTHFELRLTVQVARVTDDPGFIWCAVDEFGAHALPSVMKKVVRHTLAHVGRGTEAGG